MLGEHQRGESSGLDFSGEFCGLKPVWSCKCIDADLHEDLPRVMSNGTPFLRITGVPYRNAGGPTNLSSNND
jgi:hypothetical protein